MFGISRLYLTWFNMPLAFESLQPGPAGWSSEKKYGRRMFQRLVTICKKMQITYNLYDLNIRIYPYIYFVVAIFDGQ